MRVGFPKWDLVSDNDFGHYENVAPKANQDDRLHPKSKALPHIVTDRAIRISRERDLDRLIVWYRMPHQKLFADALDWQPNNTSVQTLMSGPKVSRDLKPEEMSYHPAKYGEISSKKANQLYRKNLRFVLEYVNILLKNVDAETAVISSDHGEGLGEGKWGHPYGYPWSPIRTVPWAVTEATDEQTYDPKYSKLQRELDSNEQIEHLKDMGYI